MDDSSKRKEAPTGSDAVRPFKKKMAGNNNKWQTPHQQARALNRGSVEPGDMGIWTTCARGMEGKAARELELLFDEYAEKVYNIKPKGQVMESEDDEAGDIESSIQKELDSLKPAVSKTEKRTFTLVRMHVECLLFTKTQAPVDPVDFAHQICKDAASEDSPGRSSRYLNRLTPITLIGKATEKAIEELATKILRRWFTLRGDSHEAEANGQGTWESPEVRPAYSYAIRPSVRNHKGLKRDDVIKQVASLIDDRHKVNLGAPDKVILVDIYQSVCGMSVVEGDWDELKRYNLTEIYNNTNKKKPGMTGESKMAETNELVTA